MDTAQIFAIGIYLISILISMTLHEVMHGFAGYWLGDDTAQKMGRLTFNPLAHIDPYTTILMPIMSFMVTGIPFGAAKPVPFNPGKVKYGEYGAAMVGFAGPLTNLVLAIVTGLWARFIFTGVVSDILELFMFTNLAFFVFNMIPWPPLDGSRIIYAFAPDPVRDVMRKIESMGIMGIFFFVFIAYNFLSPMISRAVLGLSGLILG